MSSTLLDPRKLKELQPAHLLVKDIVGLWEDGEERLTPDGYHRDFGVALCRLGAMGISGGGMHTLFSTCMDERIKACVISGYFCTFRDSILAMHHCPCNFVPGLHQFGEMHDLAELVAPRPLLVEAGARDPIFPIRAVKKSVQAARRHYQVWDQAGQVETDYFEGRHQISGRRAYDFLREKLSG